jgi:hypothetical protein
MNTSAEVHATTHGIYAGLTEWKGTELPNNPDVQLEPHYYKGGYICGTLLRWTAILLLGSRIL